MVASNSGALTHCTAPHTSIPASSAALPPENFPFCAKTVADQVCDVPSQVATSLKNPNPLIEFWLCDHPSLSERVKFAQQYDPWSRNETQFVR